MFAKPRFAKVATALCACALLLLPMTLAADEPLHQRIDALVDGLGPKAPTCSDGEFVRRVYLDLVGVIPTAEEARAFIEDASPNKRAKLVDQLLADERFAHYVASVFDAMLMERRPEKYVKNGQWSQYLLESFRTNKPLDQLCREILTADPQNEDLKPATRFYLDREVQPHLVTRDVGRLMLGRDLQCAQCHDHPVIGDYSQAEYYGLYSFVHRSYLFNDKKKKQFALAEKARGEVTYESVFIEDSKSRSGAQLLWQPEVDEPVLPAEKLFKVPPSATQGSVPEFSRREALAAGITSGDYDLFNRNMANRLWAVMFGRGIVHPLDLHHDENPPVHPELLTLLAKELAAMEFDTRSFLRQIALSETYQRSCSLEEDPTFSPSELTGIRDALQQQHEAQRDAARAAHQAVWEIESQIEEVKQPLVAAKTKWQAVQGKLVTAREKLDKLNAQVAAAQKEFEKQKGDAAKQKAQQALEQAKQNLEPAKQELEQAQQAFQTAGADYQELKQQSADKLAALWNQRQQAHRQARTMQDDVHTLHAELQDVEVLLALANAKSNSEVLEARQKLLQRWTERFFVYGLQPLSPEQLTLSLYQASEDLSPRLDGARLAEQKKATTIDPKQKMPAKPIKPPTAQDIENRAHETVYNQLGGVINEVVRVFEQTPGQPTQEFEGRSQEALYLANSPRVKGLVAGRLARRLTTLEDNNKAIEELYLAVLSRKPDSAEIQTGVEFLASRDKDRQAAIEEMMWGLVSSIEFRFNH